MHVEILSTPFNPWEKVTDYQARRVGAGRCGAMVLFVGTMRDFNLGEKVEEMHVEHYRGMTEKHISDAVERCFDGHDIEDVLVIHRVGRLHPGEPIVAVAVWAAHRRDAFAVNRLLVEELKSKTPFWKKEVLPGAERWVKAESDAGV